MDGKFALVDNALVFISDAEIENTSEAMKPFIEKATFLSDEEIERNPNCRYGIKSVNINVDTILFFGYNIQGNPHNRPNEEYIEFSEYAKQNGGTANGCEWYRKYVTVPQKPISVVFDRKNDEIFVNGRKFNVKTDQEYTYLFQKTQVKAIDGIDGLFKHFVGAMHVASAFNSSIFSLLEKLSVTGKQKESLR